MRLLIVDDSRLYVEMLLELMTEEERQATGLTYVTAASSTEALAAAARDSFDVAIVDVDLGATSESGLAVVRMLRARDPALKICVHSNGAPFSLQKRAAQAGADLFLPKPMARDHLLRLLKSAPDAPAETRDLPLMAVVDDDALILETWEALPGYRWLTFESPDALLAALDEQPELLPSLAAVVTDFTFVHGSGQGEVRDGALLAETLTDRRADLPVFLSTDRPFPRLPRGVVAKVAKDAPMGLAEIRRHLHR